MAEEIHYLNFRISEEMKEKLDESARLSGWDRSKQARACIAFALGMEEPRPYIPMARPQAALPFRKPAYGAPGKRTPRVPQPHK